MRLICLVITLLCSFYGNAQLTHSFFDSSGTSLTYDSVIDQLANSDVILFGELHDNALIHWLQYRVSRDLIALKKLGRSGGLTMGAEFFERDNQLLINEYQQGIIDGSHFEEEARLWPNYHTDYKPLLQLANDSDIKFIATNIPRRYAALVAQMGTDSLANLSSEAKKLLPKLPLKFSLDTPGYKDLLEMMGGHGAHGKGENFAKAQALKDATMAESILKNLVKNRTFLHFNGDFHSANYGGIYWHLKSARPSLKITVIKVFTSNDLQFSQSFAGSGDIILLLVDDFTHSY